MGCLAEDTWLCRDCRQQVPAVPLTCIGCGRPPSPRHGRGYAGQGARTCRQCRDRIPLTGVVSVGPYASPLLRRGIHWLKFQGVRPCAAPLAAVLADRLIAIAPLPLLRRDGLLIPIPLHGRRQRERGFNQSADIAASLSVAAGIPATDVLTRTRFTWTQTKLPPALRVANAAGAFTATAQQAQLLANKRWLLLIDDVTTTGSTLSAAGAVLRPLLSQTAEVWGVTVARG